MTQALSAYADHGSDYKASRALGIPRPTFQARLARARAWQAAGRPDSQTSAGRMIKPHVPEEGGRTYEQAWLEWQRYIGQATSHHQRPPKSAKGARKKIVIAGDFHIPFHDKRAVARLFTQEKDADLLILNGDIQDFYAISRFIKYEHVSIDQELAEVTLFLEQASATWPEVLITTGNHDVPRFEKQLRERVPEDIVKVIEFLAGGNLSPIHSIASRFPNITVARNQVHGHTVAWYAQVGDLIVTHAEKFSVTPGATLRKVDEWLRDMDLVLDLKPWRVLIQAHTHALGLFPWEADKLLLEGACMCRQHGYQLGARIGGRPQRLGYWTLDQVNGKTDIASVKMHWLDAA